jgi:predicted membrane chloride channel (bestrophin family)
MIRYDNKQQALRIICRLHGSVFPRTLLPALFSAALTLVFALELCPRMESAVQGYMVEGVPCSCAEPMEGCPTRVAEISLPDIRHPFAVQIFAIVLGYVIVFRTNMALNRYRDGMTNIQLMTSKWGDAFMQLKAFCATDKATCSDEVEREIDNFLLEVLHWFTLLNALAMIVLRDEDTTLSRFTYSERVKQRSTLSERNIPSHGSDVVRDEEEFAQLPAPPEGLPEFRVIGRMTKAEKRALEDAPDMVLFIAQWIAESVTVMHVKGFMSTPGPILSRFFQEMSNGMLGFNQAYKITFVPFPFPFAQILGALLCLFVVICPVMVVQMTKGMFIPPVLSFAAILGYWGLNQIAVELENPFGDDPNDLPLPETHVCFVDALEEAYISPPRPVNQRKPKAEAKAGDPAVLTLNEELEERGVKHRFSLKLNIRCLSVFSLSDLEKKFEGDHDLAYTIHARIRELVAGSKEGSAAWRRADMANGQVHEKSL